MRHCHLTILMTTLFFVRYLVFDLNTAGTGLNHLLGHQIGGLGITKAGINIGMISTSEIKISVTVEEGQIEEAARVVHTAFGLDA